MELKRLHNGIDTVGFRVKDKYNCFDINSDVANLFSLHRMVYSDVRVVFDKTRNEFVSPFERSKSSFYPDISDNLELVLNLINKLNIDSPVNSFDLEIFIEDNGSGFKFYNTLISKMFAGFNINVVGADGVSNLASLVNECRNKHMLVIFDFAVNYNETFKIIQAIRNKVNKGYRVSYFSPLSFEEVLLSYSKLLTTINREDSKDVYLEENKRLKSGEIYDWSKFNISSESCEYLGTKASNMEKLLSKLVRKALSRTVLAYSKGKLSDCWMTDCSISCSTLSKLGCTPVNGDKLLSICESSLACGLHNIITQELGVQPSNYLSSWSDSAKRKLYGRCY